MIAYLREIRTLLDGSGRALLNALALCSASAVLDLACMAVLPIFLFQTLAGPGHLDDRIPFLGALQGWLPAYRDLVLAVVVTFTVRGILSLYVNARLTRLAEGIRARLIHRFAHAYLTCPYQAMAARSVSAASTMAGAYTATFAHSVALPGLRLLLDGMTLLAILGFLLVLDYRVVGVTALVLAVVGTGYYLSVRRVAERQSRRLAELQESLGHQLSRALHSPREVRVFRLHDQFLGGIGQALERGARAQANLTVVSSLPRVLGELTLIGLALGYLAYRSHGGTNSVLLMSQLALLGFAGLRLLPTFAQGLGHVALLRAGRHVTGLLARELAALGAPAPAAAAHPAPAETFESLELREVSFAYATTGRTVLDRISLRIRRGESIGIVGSSGAGKSTLGDVILGLLEPASGEIRVNGRPARLASEAWWRTVGFVPQAVFLSNDTLLHNIAFGIAPDAVDRARAARAASSAQLDELIRSLPRGIDSQVGDFGTRLSGGQRQRVAIARALYHERQFLVLDEATSSLDTETEKAVVQAVASMRGTITTFIIAHRRSTLEGCDAIVEISDGRLEVVRGHAREPGAVAAR